MQLACTETLPSLLADKLDNRISKPYITSKSASRHIHKEIIIFKIKNAETTMSQSICSV